MANIEDIKVVITGEDKASGVLSSIGKSVSGFGSVAGTVAKAGLYAFTAGFTALAGAAALAVHEFDESDKVLKQLDAVLASTKGVAGVTKDSILELANSLQKTTTFSDEAVISAENLLLTFTSIGKDVFPQATKTVLDMSAALGQDAKSSAIQLGKALNDPIIGVSALRKVGVSFTEDQQNVIKALVETGNKLGAQKIILEELNKEFGGSAAAAADTFSGKMIILKNTISDFLETAGKPLVDILKKAIDKLIEFASRQDVQEKIALWSQQIAAFISYVTDFKARWDELRDGVMRVVDAVTEWFTKLITQNPVVIAILDAMKFAWDQIWSAIKDNLIPAFQEFYQMLEPHLPIIKEFVKDLALVFGVILLGALLIVIRTVGILIAIFADVVAAGTKIVSFLVDIFIKTWEGVIEVIAKAIELVNKFIDISKKAASGGGLGFTNKIGDTISGALGIGARASGGPVSGGSPYLVGEQGPELFIPGSNGQISPNGRGVGSTVINITGTFLSQDAAEAMANLIFDKLKLEARI